MKLDKMYKLLVFFYKECQRTKKRTSQGKFGYCLQPKPEKRTSAKLCLDPNM